MSSGCSTTDEILPRCSHQQPQELTVLPSHWILSELPNLLSPGKQQQQQGQQQVQLEQAGHQQTSQSHPHQHPTLPWGEQQNQQPWPQVGTQQLPQLFHGLPSRPPQGLCRRTSRA